MPVTIVDRVEVVEGPRRLEEGVLVGGDEQVEQLLPGAVLGHQLHAEAHGSSSIDRRPGRAIAERR